MERSVTTDNVPQTWLARVLLRDLASVRSQLEAYPDEALIWQTPPGMTNSAGTLALHIAGNLLHFIGAKLGGTGYVRDRVAEFELRDVPRAELIDGLERATRAVQETLATLPGEDLDQVFPDTLGGLQLTTGQYLVHLAMHLGYHVGQLDYHRRAVTGDPSIPGMVSLPALIDATST
jgi:hypothetical protein